MLMFYLSMMDDGKNELTFESIYQAYADGIFKRTYHILKSQEDAEDAMQETWMKVIQNIEVLRGKSDRVIKAYIMKIAKNEAITIIRKRKKDTEILCTVEGADIASEDDLFELCEKNDISEIVKCFAELDDIYRDVLSFYYFYHHSIKEIAKIMNMNEATVNSRLTRGRKKLMILLKRRGYHERT